MEIEALRVKREANIPAGLSSGKHEFGTIEYNTEVIRNSSQFKKNLLVDQRLTLKNAKSALNSLETLNQLMNGVNISNKDAKSVFGEGTGPLKGRLRTLAAQLGGDSTAAAINATIVGLIPNVARGVFGEVGVLTDNDIANYRKTVGSMNLPGEENKSIQYFLTDVLVKTYGNALTQAAMNQQDVSLFEDEYKSMEKRSKALKDSLSGNPFQTVVKSNVFDATTGLFNIPESTSSNK